MFGRSSTLHSPAMEALKWASIFALACALVLQLTRRLDGSEPPRLPNAIKTTAISLDEWGRFEPADHPSRLEVAERFRKTLSLHSSDDPQTALQAWKSFSVPAELMEWKLIAMGAASFQMMQLDEAVDYLNSALELGGENPVSHYQLALVYLAKAATENETQSPQIVLVSTSSQASSPDARYMFRMAAIVELEKALISSTTFDMDKTILDPTTSSSTHATAPLPTVREFASALGIENLKGSAHSLLGTLAFEDGDLPRAETNLDLAAELGVEVQIAYENIAEYYEEHDDHPNAARLYLKSAGKGNRLAGPISKALENLYKAW